MSLKASARPATAGLIRHSERSEESPPRRSGESSKTRSCVCVRQPSLALLRTAAKGRARWWKLIAPGLAALLLWLSPAVAVGAEGSLAPEPAIKTLLPEAGKAWGAPTDVETFGPDNLFELIDGEAESYLAYGFQEVVAARYALKAHDEPADVRIYRMADPLRSFGIFSIQRGPSVTPLDVGAQGFEAGSNVYFIQGRYFVQVEGPAYDTSSIGAVRGLARAASAKLPEPKEVPAELDYLPKERMQALSLFYVTRGVLGQEFLRNGLLANYAVGKEFVGAFLTFWEDESGAGAAFNSYADYAKTRASGFDAITCLADEAFGAVDPYQKVIVVVRKGRFVFGAVRADDVEKARQLAAHLLEHIAAMEKQEAGAS